jgi:2-haloacid dehalogenase
MTNSSIPQEAEKMNYDVYLIDADDTLYDFNTAEGKTLTTMLGMYGIQCTGEIRRQYRAISAELWGMFERGELDKDVLLVERFVRLAKILGVSFDAVEFNRRYLLELGAHSDLLCGAEELCRQLHVRGKTIYIVTNGASLAQYPRLEGSRIKPYIAGIFVSEDVGWQKPQREYFDYVLAHIPPVEKRRILMVGDSLSSDMRGGANADLDTCWYNPAGKAPGEAKPTYTVATLGEIIDL